MKKWVTVFLLAFAGSFAFYVWRVVPTAPAVPVAKGISLSAWLRAQDSSLELGPEQVETLRTYGTDGAVWLIWASRNGWQPKKALNPLEKFAETIGLRNSDPYDEQNQARWALDYLELQDADSVVPVALVNGLRSDDLYVPFDIINALNRMLPASLPVLLAAAADPDLRVRNSAIQALKLPGEALSRLAPNEIDQVTQTIRISLKDPEASIRNAALMALFRGGSSTQRLYEKDIPLVISLLDDPNPSVCFLAASTLRLFGPKASAALTKLIAMLSSREARVRIASILALLEIDETQTSKPEIAKLTSDPDSDCRAYAEVALARFSPNEVDRLLELLKHSDPTVRLQSALRLPLLGPNAAASAPAILESLRLPNASCQGGMIGEFIRFGTDAAAAAWIEALDHPHAYVQEQAAEAFYDHAELLSDPAALAAVRKAAVSGGPRLKKIAARAVEKFQYSKEP